MRVRKLEAGAPFPFLSLGIALGLSESDQFLHLVGVSEETERRLLVLVLETAPRARGQASSGAVAGRSSVSALSPTSQVTAPHAPDALQLMCPLAAYPFVGRSLLGAFSLAGSRRGALLPHHTSPCCLSPRPLVSCSSPSPLGRPLASCWGLHHSMFLDVRWWFEQV